MAELCPKCGSKPKFGWVWCEFYEGDDLDATLGYECSKCGYLWKAGKGRPNARMGIEEKV